MATKSKTTAKYTEIFRSPALPTKEDAEAVLQHIRNAHSEKHGWYEVEAHVEPLPNGTYVAVRKHYKV